VTVAPVNQGTVAEYKEMYFGITRSEDARYMLGRNVVAFARNLVPLLESLPDEADVIEEIEHNGRMALKLSSTGAIIAHMPFNGDNGWVAPYDQSYRRMASMRDDVADWMPHETRDYRGCYATSVVIAFLLVVAMFAAAYFYGQSVMAR